MSGGWAGSTRGQRLPADWNTRCKPQAHRRNPLHICHWCGRAGGDELDHIVAGDDHSPGNLDWIHSWRSVQNGTSQRNCHGEKTSLEGQQAKAARRRPKPVHPALR